MSTNVKKKSTAGGGKFSYKYSDLATIHEEMEAQGIKYYQYTEFDEKAQADYIYTVIIKDGQENKPLRGAEIVTGETLAGGNAAQQYGSALTYARRYSLLMALGWATEDDDGAGAGAATPARPQNQTYQGHADGRLDFDSLKSWLETMNTVDEVNAAKAKCIEKYPKMTEKQRNAVNRIFATKLDHLENPGEPDGWHEAVRV